MFKVQFFFVLSDFGEYEFLIFVGVFPKIVGGGVSVFVNVFLFYDRVFFFKCNVDSFRDAVPYFC